MKSFCVMKRYWFYFVCPLLLLASCGKDAVPATGRDSNGAVSHDMIQLGEKLKDPYTVENMRTALTKVYPTKAGRVDISATDLYVRFLPPDEESLRRLQERGVYLMDHPMDYRIVKEGDYYQDPEVGPDAITWQYALVPRDFDFPDGIKWELLDECYLSENDPSTRSMPDIDWAEVEREAFRISGNADMLGPDEPTRASAKATPHGRITIVDPGANGGKAFGVAGVKVVANCFVKIATSYTDRDGYYSMKTEFSSKPRYRLVFENSMGFSIGLNLIVISGSVSTMGTGPQEGLDLEVTSSSDRRLFTRCVVNNAAYDYYSRCVPNDLDIASPPSDIRLWIFQELKASSAVMLHHGAFIDRDLFQKYLGDYSRIIKLFLPDITLGVKEKEDYSLIWSVTTHELAHGSHYSRVGNNYWTPYVDFILSSYLEGGTFSYGTDGAEDSGYCAVGESWAYFMQSSLWQDRYGGDMPLFGAEFWFHPQIFIELYSRGMSRGDLFRALKKDVTSMDDLKDTLLSLYPDQESTISLVFARYGC